ncbi:hypothetical protein [Sphingomonas flavescens]|uniref:hypothetical protein n=1 Tax=Sphingomonas flavescens TaxID=3132797 RepID=UPI002803CB79|nr:hypothetical protein [Sphingomonas limnosediminicola]
MTYYLNGIPNNFEDELFAKYREIERNFRERRWEPAELNGGKLCEVAYSILKGHVDGCFSPKPGKPSNFRQACLDLEKANSSFGRSVRLLIPSILIPLYDIRNSRSVGHIGGDVDPNHMDSVCVLHMSKWVVSELIRLFYGVSIDEAQNLVEAISERQMPLVWETGVRRRVLATSLTMLEKTLVLLYSSADPVAEADLVADLEHSNATVYRRDILRKAHRVRLLEYDPSNKLVSLSPLGSTRVEEDVLPKINL